MKFNALLPSSLLGKCNDILAAYALIETTLRRVIFCTSPNTRCALYAIFTPTSMHLSTYIRAYLHSSASKYNVIEN